MKKTLIDAKIGSMSLVGVRGQYPFARGNYCSNTQGIYFCNIWAENLVHVCNVLGLLPDGKIEVMLFKDDTKTNYVYAYVIDERVPKEALHAPYFCGIKESDEVIRYHEEISRDDSTDNTNSSNELSMGKIFDSKGNEYDLDSLYQITPRRASQFFRQDPYIGKLSENFDFTMNEVSEIKDAMIGKIKRRPPKLEFGHAYTFVMKSDDSRAVGIWQGSEVGFACGPVYVTMSEIDTRTIKELKE